MAEPTNIAPQVEQTLVPAAVTLGDTFDISKPLRWSTANAVEQKVMTNLQGNILKGHGRDHTENIFFSFVDGDGNGDVAKVRRALREIGNDHVTSAYRQLLDTEEFKRCQKEPDCHNDGTTFCSLFITALGYTQLGEKFVTEEPNLAFNEPGMKGEVSRAQLGDPELTSWDTGFQKDISAMLLVADDNTARGDGVAKALVGLLRDAGCVIVKRQKGKAIKNEIGNGLEHFGYVDGRSQPLMLLEDIEAESRDDGIAHWDPTSGLDRALVKDPLVNDPENLTYGSFFIFRKLEQRVRAFKTAEQDVADALKLTGEARELAGALLVGRFEDGTPVTMSDEAKGLKKPRNDFNYDADQLGSRCPFHSHIRKTNPRGSSAPPPAGGPAARKEEQQHLMARRGITYEDIEREVHPANLPDADDKDEFLLKVAPLLPENGVGLLFMAYNARLDEQFVHTQVQWANNTGYPPCKGLAGLDGVIGQPALPPAQHAYKEKWDEPGSKDVNFTGFNDFVRMKGGEYFFAPSVRYLRSL
jgi:Dyp-type peroxidase family